MHSQSQSIDSPQTGGVNPIGYRRALVTLVALTFALQAHTWWNLEGYQLADSVEYMERAQAVVRNEAVIDSQQIRSFGFSALLSPIFVAADVVGLGDSRLVVGICRVLQMLLGLTLVGVCMRLGRALGGAWAGIAAGFVVATNPVFLKFSVSPVAGICAALCMGMGVLELLPGPSSGRGRRAGVWLGVGMWMAYKTIPITLALVLFVALRDRRRSIAILRPLIMAYTVAVLLQIGMDKIAYGEWGASLIGYVGENAVGILSTLAFRLGFHDWADSLNLWYYAEYFTEPLKAGRVLHSAQDPTWYWSNLTSFAVLPVAIMALLGCVRAVLRGGWNSSMLLGVSALNIYLLSQKGSKEFRLWLPLLPLLAPLAGWGLAWVIEACKQASLRRAVVLGAMAVTTLLALQTRAESNTRRFGGFWRAMEYVNQRVEDGYEPVPFIVDYFTDEETHTRNAGRPRVACSYHWSVFSRQDPGVQLVKLPHQLDGWRHLSPEQRADTVIPSLERLDWLIVHQPLLTDLVHHTLMHFVNAWYTVEAAFWDPEVHEDIGPVLVLRRKRDVGFDHERPTFYDIVRGPKLLAVRSLVDLVQQMVTLRLPSGQKAFVFWMTECLRQRLGFGEPMRFIRPNLGEELWVLGSTYETLPGDDLGWLSLYMFVWSPMQADYTFTDRLTTSSGEGETWENRHMPAYGVERTNKWRAGTLVRESWPVLAVENTANWRELGRSLGEAYRAGEYIPVEHWTGAATFYWACTDCGGVASEDPTVEHDCDGVLWSGSGREVRVSGRLERGHFGDNRFVRLLDPLARSGAEREWRWDMDGLSRVGSFFLPVQRNGHFAHTHGEPEAEGSQVGRAGARALDPRAGIESSDQ